MNSKILKKMNFNIIKEIYLNKDNRVILESVIHYIKRNTRSKIGISFRDYGIKDAHICVNCFRLLECKHLICTQRYFCYECSSEHYDKYTSDDVVVIHELIRQPFTRNNDLKGILQSPHNCEFNEGFFKRDFYIENYKTPKAFYKSFGTVRFSEGPELCE